MALPRVYRVVQDSLGNVVPQVLCSVLNEGTGVLATLWQDDTATIPLSNPMTSDATYGSFGFYVEPGHYDLTFTKPGYTFQPQLDMQVPQDDLTLGTMAQQDAANVAITGGTVTGLSTLRSALIGVGMNPAFPLDVTGNTRLQAVGLNRAPLAGHDLATLGDVLIGNHLGIATTALSNIRLAIAFDKSNRYGLKFNHTVNDTAPGQPILFNNTADTAVGSISTTATATAYNTSSDVRLKQKIQELLGGVAAIKCLRPVSYVWNSTDEPDIGFLAHELMTVAPGAVQGLPDAVNPDGTIKPQQVDQSKLIPLLTSAIKELLAQVEALTARVAALETQLGV